MLALEIEITKETETGLSLSVPPYRVDITRDVDIVEEILRIYGYNNIEIPTQIRASLNTSLRPDNDSVQNQLADMLTANGFNEIMSNSLTKLAYLTDPGSAVKVLNPLSSDLDVMRQTMLYSGLEAIAYNSNRRNQNLKLYEFGKVYHKKEDKYVEDQRFSLFITGAISVESWQGKLKAGTFYDLKAVVDAVIERLKIKNISVDDVGGENFSYGLEYKSHDKQLVQFGSVNQPALKKAGVDQEVFYADFNFELLLTQSRKNKIIYQEVSKYPSVKRDLSMLIDKTVTFGQLKHIAQKTERKLLKDVAVFDVYQGDKLPAGKKSYALSFTLQDDEKTLTDTGIDTVMQKLIHNFEKEIGAEVRK